MFQSTLICKQKNLKSACFVYIFGKVRGKYEYLPLKSKKKDFKPASFHI